MATLCTDCEKGYHPAECHAVDDHFVKGYDQALLEVLDEVHERSPTMCSALLNKYPVWQEVWQRRADQMTLAVKYAHLLRSLSGRAQPRGDVGKR